MDLLVGKLSAHNRIMPQVNLSTVSWQATFGIVIILLQTLASSGDLNFVLEQFKERKRKVCEVSGWGAAVHWIPPSTRYAIVPDKTLGLYSRQRHQTADV
jgi:hypothetical protein